MVGGKVFSKEESKLDEHQMFDKITKPESDACEFSIDEEFITKEGFNTKLSQDVFDEMLEIKIEPNVNMSKEESATYQEYKLFKNMPISNFETLEEEKILRYLVEGLSMAVVERNDCKYLNEAASLIPRVIENKCWKFPNPPPEPPPLLGQE